jgi:hypothetical protein
VQEMVGAESGEIGVIVAFGAYGAPRAVDKA